ncbi:MAG: hypothetical protein ACJ79E_12200 [Anaeromyxobacteraceae bacterium]
MAKTILCSCEDATVADVRRAFEKGYRHLRGRWSAAEVARG